MRRAVLATTSLVVVGGMAAADVSVSGSAELGVSGAKGEDAKLHKDIDVNFNLSGETDGGLTFGASIDLDEAAAENALGELTYDAQGHVFISGAFGTLTLGDTDGAYDKALTEVGSGTSLADDHTGHEGYDGNVGIDDSYIFLGRGSGPILRYDYTAGNVVASVSAASLTGLGPPVVTGITVKGSVHGAGVAWSGDVGGFAMDVGLGYQSGSSRVSDGATRDVSIIGMSVSTDMGNGLSVVANRSRLTNKWVSSDRILDGDAGDSGGLRDYSAIGLAYSVGDLTVGVNAGRKSTKALSNVGGSSESLAKIVGSGVGLAVVYGLGTGASFQFGIGSGSTEIAAAVSSKNTDRSWSAGLAFSF